MDTYNSSAYEKIGGLGVFRKDARRVTYVCTRAWFVATAMVSVPFLGSFTLSRV